MQTRKNRKNDETSYEKMLRLRRDLQRVRTLLEMVKEREKKKVDVLHCSIDIFEKRVILKDFNGSICSELSAAANVNKSTFLPLYPYQYTNQGNSLPGLGKSSLNAENTNMINSGSVGILTNSNNTVGLPANTCGRIYPISGSSQYIMNNNQDGNRKEKRQYKKRKLKLPRERRSQDHNQCLTSSDGVSNAMSTSLACHRPSKYFHLSNTSPTRNDSNLDTEDDDLANVNKFGSESEEDSLYSFKRRPNCDYQRPCVRTEAWPWEVTPEEKNEYADMKYRYTLTSLSYPRSRCIGFARRRLGRGGRVVIDRANTTYDDLWSQLDYTIIESKSDRLKKELETTNENQSNDESDELLDDNIDMRFVSELMFHRRQQRLLEERINEEQTQTHYKQSFNNLSATKNLKTENNNPQRTSNNDKCMEINSIVVSSMSPSVYIKEEDANKEPSVGVSSTDDSNEPLSSLKNKNNHLGTGEDDDEENVNLAELSNLIKHSNATNQNQKSDMKAEEMPYICTTKDLVLFDDDDVLSSTLNDMEDVARERSFLPKRKTAQEQAAIKRNALLNYTKVFSGIYNDWLHFRPHHNLSDKPPSILLNDTENNMPLPTAMDLDIQIGEDVVNLYDIDDETERKLCSDDTDINSSRLDATSTATVGHSMFKISLPDSHLPPPTLLQIKAPAQLLEVEDLTKESASTEYADLSLVKDETTNNFINPEAFQQVKIKNKSSTHEIASDVFMPEQTKTKNILFQMHNNNNIATNNCKAIGKVIPALQMNEENKTKLNPLVYAASSAYGQKIFIQKTPMSGITLANTVDKQIPYTTSAINIVRKDGVSDETLAQYAILKQKKNVLSSGPLLFTTGNITRHVQLDNTNSTQNNTADNIIVTNQNNTVNKNSLPTSDNKEIINNQKKILFANLISSSVQRNPTNYGGE